MPVNSSSALITNITINSGQSLSQVANISPLTLHGIIIPSNWTTASISFQFSPDGGVTFYEMDSVSGNLVYSVTAGHFLALDPTLWRSVNSLKVRSGTVGSPVNQTATVSLGLALTTVF